MSKIWLNWKVEPKMLVGYSGYTCNSDSSFNIYASLKYETDKTIKYIHLFFCSFNRVGDQDSSVQEIRLTGPFDGVGFVPDSSDRLGYWISEMDWFKLGSPNGVRLILVLVEYMDGTEERIDGNCVERYELPSPPVPDKIEISKTTAFLLHFFLGFWGIGDFYCGREGIGIAKILTGGGFFIWGLVDAFRVLAGSYQPGDRYIFK